MTTTSTATRGTCVRCSGTGAVPLAFDNGRCFACDGTGTPATKAAKAAIKASAATRRALRQAAIDAGQDAANGVRLLEDTEPARFAKAVESFAAGDARVVPALAAYWVAR